MAMWGNDTTGEMVSIMWVPQTRSCRAVQWRPATRLLNEESGPNWNAHMRQWWEQYRAQSKGTFYKLTKVVVAGESVQTELSDVSQGVELPYTDSSDGRHRQ